jgi:farnesyl diphosphate synthase
MGHALFGGGKRLRPALVRAICAQLGGADQAALIPACAIEMVHTYSLIHDDLPCMDDDDLRRGRPTCHVVYGEALAVLAGDGLLTRALGYLADKGGRLAAQQVAVLARAAGEQGMVLGQALDLAQEGHVATAAGVREIHALKTGALLGAAVELGALAAEADPAPLRPFGQALGLLFQAVDDVLDVTGEAALLGKTPGKDAAVEKATLVAALGLAGAREEVSELTNAALAAGEKLGWDAGDRPLALVRAMRDRRH